METTQGTYALGGSDGSGPRSEVLHLDCPENQIERCQWQEMKGKLEELLMCHCLFRSLMTSAIEQHQKNILISKHF